MFTEWSLWWNIVSGSLTFLETCPHPQESNERYGRKCWQKMLTIFLSYEGVGPRKPIRGRLTCTMLDIMMLSILKWSPMSPGPASCIRCTNNKALSYHAFIPSKWRHHPSCCTTSEPRNHPGHSLFHSPSITNLPISLVHFSSMASNSLHLLCSKLPSPFGRLFQ